MDVGSSPSSTLSSFNEYGKLSWYEESSDEEQELETEECADPVKGTFESNLAWAIRACRPVLPTTHEIDILNPTEIYCHPSNLPPPELRALVANINSVTLGILVQHEAIPESYYLALELLHTLNRTVYNVLVAAIKDVHEAWAQVVRDKMARACRNPMAVAGMTLPTLAQLAALRRRMPSALGLYNPNNLPPPELRGLVANINLGILTQQEAIPESYYMTAYPCA